MSTYLAFLAKSHSGGQVQKQNNFKPSALNRNAQGIKTGQLYSILVLPKKGLVPSNGTKSVSECQQKDSQSKDFGTYKIEGGQKKGYGPENHKTDKVVISYAKKNPHSASETMQNRRLDRRTRWSETILLLPQSYELHKYMPSLNWS